MYQLMYLIIQYDSICDAQSHTHPLRHFAIISTSRIRVMIRHGVHPTIKHYRERFPHFDSFVRGIVGYECCFNSLIVYLRWYVGEHYSHNQITSSFC